MGRAPCCDKVGLKKGPWTPEEDHILISFIQRHGHSNWRALPKLSGLLRCGKSCRLRWINYLKPDIKRGNFTKEEEDTIIQLHEMMGNRWSAIAARLSGRTDNEIKNVWHTHLKKRLPKYQITKAQGKAATSKKCQANNVTNTNPTSTNNFPETSGGVSDFVPTISNSQQSNYTSSSDGFSSNTEVSSMEVPNNTCVVMDESNLDYFSIIDETFWSSQDFSELPLENIVDDNQLHFSFSENDSPVSFNNLSTVYDGQNGMGNYEDFWFDVFVKASGATELPEF